MSTINQYSSLDAIRVSIDQNQAHNTILAELQSKYGSEVSSRILQSAIAKSSMNLSPSITGLFGGHLVPSLLPSRRYAQTININPEGSDNAAFTAFNEQALLLTRLNSRQFARAYDEATDDAAAFAAFRLRRQARDELPSVLNDPLQVHLHTTSLVGSTNQVDLASLLQQQQQQKNLARTISNWHMYRDVRNASQQCVTPLLLTLPQAAVIRSEPKVQTNVQPAGQVAPSLQSTASSMSKVITPKESLQVLGRTMISQAKTYIDASTMPDPSPIDIARRRTRGGVTEPFPEKLHRMLNDLVKRGDTDIASFFSHGRAFAVHDGDRFVADILPKFFKQSRLTSFYRQLNLWGFVRVQSGLDVGGYYHPLFLKGRPALAVHMRRVGVPDGDDRRKRRALLMPKQDPDFYTMVPISASNHSSSLSSSSLAPSPKDDRKEGSANDFHKIMG